MPEILRQRHEAGSEVDVACLGCKRPITLWWNGGELDAEWCCGYWYSLRHAPSVDLVISKTTNK